MADYKKTLNLPKTAYPMKADLVHKEPETLKFWEQNNTYEVMQNASGAKGTYVLHDGPPYANGHIHLGTALNKILKDIIIKSKNLAGYKTQCGKGTGRKESPNAGSVHSPRLQKICTEIP